MVRQKKQRKKLWCKKTIIIWNVNVDNIVISNLIETNNNSKYLIGYLDEVIKWLDMSKHLKIKMEIKTIH